MSRPMILLAALALGLPDAALAIDACKFLRVEQDKFSSGATSIVAPGRILTWTDEGASLLVVLGIEGLTGDVLRPGTPGTFLTEDGTKVELWSDNEGQPTAKAYISSTGGSSLSTAWEVNFPLSSEAVHALALSPTVAIKYEVVGKQYTVDVARRSGRGLQRDFACLANLMPTEAADASE